MFSETIASRGGPATPSARGARLEGGLLVVLLLATALAYLPAVGGDFHWDDDLAVLTRAKVLEPSGFGWRDLVPPALVRDRPLADLTFAANHALTGNANAPFVLTNVGVHLAAVVLAFLLVRRILRRAGIRGAAPLALA